MWDRGGGCEPRGRQRMRIAVQGLKEHRGGAAECKGGGAIEH